MAEEEKGEVCRRYSKDDNPRVELKDLPFQSIPSVPAGKSTTLAYIYSENGRSYYKGEGQRDYFLVVLIIEDAKRTHQYFIPICKESGSRFKICPVCNRDHGIPACGMLKTAAGQVKELGLDFSAGDYLYMLCDLDHYSEALCELNAQEREWNMIISNPCIELWFYYHKRDCKLDLGGCARDDKYPKLMKSICETLCNGGGIDHRKLFTTFDALAIPIANARKNYVLEPYSDFMPALGSTQMFVVMEKIQELFRDDGNKDTVSPTNVSEQAVG